MATALVPPETPEPRAPGLAARLRGTITRMIGWSAGLPQGKIVDPVLKATGAIPLRGEAPSDFQRSGTTVRVQGFERHPVVMACVREIVNIASAIDLEVYRKTKKSKAAREVVDVLGSNFPGQQLLDAPSPFFSARRLREVTWVHYLVYGNALWYLERPVTDNPNAIPKPPTSIRIVHPEDILTVYVNVKGYPIWYLWRDYLGYTHTSPSTDFVHFRDLNAKGIIFGYPRAAAALNDIIGDGEASQFVRQTVTNYGAPPVYALIEGETSPAQAKAAEEAMYEKMVNRGQRGRFAFIGGVKDIKSVSFNLKDLEFPDMRRVTREDICAAFGVDPRMIGIATATRDAGLSGTQYTEARVRLIQQTIEPLMRAFESELNFWLAPEYGDVFMRFDPKTLKALVENDNETSTRVRAEIATGMRSLEEGREAVDLPADFEAGDTLAIPTVTQIVPVEVALDGLIPGLPPGTTEKPEPPPALLPAGTQVLDQTDAGTTADAAAAPDSKQLQGTTGTNPNDPKHPPRIQDGAKDVAKDAKQKKRAGLVPMDGLRFVAPLERDEIAMVLTRSVVLTPEQRTMLWRQFDERATREEAAYRREALLLFGEERANVGRTLERSGNAHSSNDAAAIKEARRQLATSYKAGGEVQQRWADRFHPIIGQTYATGGEHVATALKANRSARRVETRDAASPEPVHPTAENVVDLSYDFNLSDPDVQRAIRDRAERLAGLVGDTTAEAIDDALALALREGMSVREAAELVDRVAFGNTASYRATTIARTESIGALNQGQHDSALASGAVEGKEWLTQGDDRVRDTHAMCEDQGMIGIAARFANGLLYPGDPEGDADEVCNCRCGLLFYDTLDEGASSLK